MEFVLGKIYAKFYICQILKSMSYYDSKMKQLDFQMLIEENYMETDEANKETPLDVSSQAVTQRTMADTPHQPERKNKEFQESLSMYDNSLYRRYFVFKGIVYSKVEIQGIVIEKRSLGYEEKNNYRFLIFIDDTTGVIQAISWKNKNDSVFSKINNELVFFYNLLESWTLRPSFGSGRLLS
jgi:hypothetical protein